jgi:hypothetical protein
MLCSYSRDILKGSVKCCAGAHRLSLKVKVGAD